MRTIVIVVSAKVLTECHSARHSKSSYASMKGPSRVHEDSMGGGASRDGKSEREIERGERERVEVCGQTDTQLYKDNVFVVD